MRVLYCTDTYSPQVNGVSVVTALSVAGLARRGWECVVVAPRYPDAVPNGGSRALAGAGCETDLVSVPSVALPLYPEVRVAAPKLGAVAGAVARFRPDLVHCETEFVIGRMGQVAARRAGVPTVSSYHTDFGRYSEAYGAPRLRRAVLSYLGRFHRRLRRTYTPSAAARNELLWLGVSDVEVWGRGVDAGLFHPGRRSPEFRAALGLRGRFTFLYVGRLASEKRVEQILHAYRLVSAALPNGLVHLVLAGAGPREAALRATAPADVTFLGYLDRRSRLPDLYANRDAFVFASDTETLGLVVLEAMASGLPVIATPAGGVAEHLRDGVNGLAFPTGDVHSMARAMIRLATGPELAHRLSGSARRTAEALSWERELDRLDRSYREVASAR